METGRITEHLISKIKTDLEPLNFETTENLIIDNKENEIKKNGNGDNSRVNSFSFSDTSSVKTSDSQRTLVSDKFMEEKDLDLPLFTSTKYTSFKWKVTHLIFYEIYSIVLLFSSFSWILKRYTNYNTLLIISHFFFLGANLMQWLYYNRGCLKDANLNTRVKHNIDKSFKAKILRSETGWIYFFSFVGSIILLYGNFIFIAIVNNIIITEFLNINFVGTMIISVTQILKIEKALIENREYRIENDLSRSMVEIFLFFGSLFYGSSYLINIMYIFDEENFIAIIAILKFIGNIFIFSSGITLIYRYFCASNKDLNTSDLSAYTL